MYKIIIGSEKIAVSEQQIREMFTAKAVKMVRKVNRQGGEIHIGAGSLKPEFRPENN